MKRATVLLVALIASAAHAGAPLDEVIPAEKGNRVCFQRIYDAAHLGQHPRQTTAAITVWMRYEPMHGSPGLLLDFGIGIKRRGEAQPFFAQGDCIWDEQGNKVVGGRRLIDALNQDAAAVCMMYGRPDVFDALSAQEGGYLMFVPGKERETLMLYLDAGLIMVKRADRDQGIDMKFGAEDRVFRLNRVDLKACVAVEEAVTQPEPGVAPRR